MHHHHHLRIYMLVSSQKGPNNAVIPQRQNGYSSLQGRISNIGKLGTCLGWQLYRGGTPTKKKGKCWKQILLIYSIDI